MSIRFAKNIFDFGNIDTFWCDVSKKKCYERSGVQCCEQLAVFGNSS